ncbi:tripartite tricarboxylate transporter TctB family protein [Marinobacterium litorale]|jgi:putative tricarboxylic transport membrane protein|uniref:tripartite tricarboxylate transporter TctB family protein n=1 Tax=Marinobacterium litorale TaxID=404770 RepID=UPI000684F2D1|nr:tripartite tricarboxylate transporter TctB family protein [Marinobacterium litorale]
MKQTDINHSEYHGRVNPNSMLGAALVILACIFIFYLVPQYIEVSGMVKNPMMSPRFLPLLAGWMVLLCSLILLVNGLLWPPKHTEAEAFHAGIPKLRWVLMLAAGAVYTMLFEQLGAITSGVIATFMLFLAHHLRHFSIYLLALLFPVVVSLLFIYLLNVPLPAGMLWE